MQTHNLNASMDARGFSLRIRSKVLTPRLALFVAIGTIIGGQAVARGVSPYLPLSMSPEMDRKIQRVLVLSGTTAIRRPIPAAVVLEALPKACKRDQALCSEVRTYLEGYMKRAGITNARVTGAAVDGDSQSTQPNSHGIRVDESWEAHLNAYFQPNDYLLIAAGGIASEELTVPTGSMLSFGMDYAQLDVGFRDHWFSPLNDSSTLISTEAQTMPSVTLSNYKPIGPLGLSYEIFAAKMSRQVDFPVLDPEAEVPVTSGKPRLAGLQAGITPAQGVAFAINRVTQYGGGARDGSFSGDLIDALTSRNNPNPGAATEFGNRAASLTSSIVFSGKVPFAVHMEYAGEDNAYSGAYRLGATNMSVGIDIPQAWRDFDFGYEISEWQNAWYVHHVYPRGLVNRGNVIGHWFGDQRVFGDAIGGSSQSVRAGWRTPWGQYLQATYRTLSLDEDWRVSGADIGYETMQSLRLDVAMDIRGFGVEAGVQVGKDVFGDSFARLQASLDLAQRSSHQRGTYSETTDVDDSTQLFVDAGASYGRIKKIFGSGVPTASTGEEINPHIAFGARRSVSSRTDFGVRVELDQLDGENLLSLRALDYRFRFNRKLAANAFFGAARYDFGLPAYGYYLGLGATWMDVLPGWDVSMDVRHHEKLGRDKTLPDDPPSTPERTRLFFDANGIAFYLSRRW